MMIRSKNFTWLPFLLPMLLAADCFSSKDDSIPDDTSSTGADFANACRNGASHVFPGEADFSDPLNPQDHEFDCWAWRTFYSLISDPRETGDGSFLPGNGSSGEGRSNDNLANFETWSDTSNLFPGAPEFENNDPPVVLPDWGSPNQLVPQVCLDLPGYDPSYKLLDQSNKSELFFTGAGPVVDANGSFLRYEVLINEPLWDSVVDNDLQTVAGQAAASAVNLPCGTDQASWSVVLKAAWKELGPNDDAGDYHVRTAIVYTPGHDRADNVDHCEVQDMALLGMHLVMKTSVTQHWGWATFEHASNAPACTSPGDATSCPTSDAGSWNLYNSDCSDCAPCNTVPVSNGTDSSDWNLDQPAQKSQICRSNPIADETEHINTGMTASLVSGSRRDVHERGVQPPTSQIWATEDTVWRNYKLVGVQWTDLDTGGSGCDMVAADRPTPEQLNPPSLANLTMEGYDQNGSDCLGCHANAITHDGKLADFQWWLHEEVAVAPDPISVPATSSFDDIWSNIIQPGCSTCHGGTSHFTGFAFNNDAETAYNQLVGVPAYELSTMNRVTASDSANSYLMHKLEGTHSSVGGYGSQMPMSGCCLDEEHLSAVRGWIDEGAARNPAQ